MRRVPRQFKHHTRGIKAGGQNTGRLQIFNDLLKFFFEESENIHFYLRIGPGSKSR